MSTMRPHQAKNILHIAAEPKFLFTPEALYKIQCYVEECDKEIGWLGRIRQDGDTYLCDEVFLLHQEVGAAATDITEAGLAALMEEIGLEENETLRLWGHSHVNMGVSPSSEDKKTPELFMKNGCAYFFRIICNKRGEMGVTFFNWQQNYYIEDMAWGILAAEDDEVRSRIKAEMAEKVKAISYGRSATSDWEWDAATRCWVLKEEKKETRQRIGGNTNGSTSATNLAVLATLYDDVPEWFVNLVLANMANNDVTPNHFQIQQLLKKYNVSYATLVDVVRFFEKGGAAETEQEAYLADLQKAYDDLDSAARISVAQFPALARDNKEVKRVLKKYKVNYDDLVDLALTVYSDTYM